MEEILARRKRKPWVIEYDPCPKPAVEVVYVREVPEMPPWGLFGLAFLELLNSLSNLEGSGIEGQGK
jgi:hypothetical protein